MLSVDTAAGILSVFGRDIPCAIGRGGVFTAEAKQEGDGGTPLGAWPILGFMLRPDRVEHVPSKVAWRWLRRSDGWSDDANDPVYNRPIRHPHRWSAEHLWREDGLYDIIVVLGHNMAPTVPGSGSAIFLHCWNDGQPTEGCVAIAKPDLLGLLPLLTPGDVLAIS